jgi:hypothetical protein
MVRKYFSDLAERFFALLFGQVEVDSEPEFCSAVVYPLPWSAVGSRVFDANGVLIFEVGLATEPQRVRDELCHSIVLSVNETGWWDYRELYF